jgi:hypothetical protein
MKHLFIITGTFHGSHILAVSEGQARRIFHQYYKGESILCVFDRTFQKWLQSHDFDF